MQVPEAHGASSPQSGQALPCFIPATRTGGLGCGVRWARETRLHWAVPFDELEQVLFAVMGLRPCPDISPILSCARCRRCQAHGSEARSEHAERARELDGSCSAQRKVQDAQCACYSPAPECPVFLETRPCQPIPCSVAVFFQQHQQLLTC